MAEPKWAGADMDKGSRWKSESICSAQTWVLIKNLQNLWDYPMTKQKEFVRKIVVRHCYKWKGTILKCCQNRM